MEIDALANPSMMWSASGWRSLRRRDADAVVVTGPVTVNMERALKDYYKPDAPDPKLVIALGDCNLARVFRDYAVTGPVNRYIPVDVQYCQLSSGRSKFWRCWLSYVKFAGFRSVVS